MAELPATGTIRRAAQSQEALLATFVAAIFLSAALLFLIEPMFTKMVLPRLGGSPSVWSVAMVFFQSMLLAGYAYAHVLTRYAPGRMSVLIHLAVMILAAFTLPFAIGAARPPAGGEAFWLIGLFTTSIGLPFFALAANGPLLQAWFARTDHPAAGDPYFLYAASNVGSFLALLSYPILIEPLIPLSGQTRLWSGAFYILMALVAGSGALLWRTGERRPRPALADRDTEAARIDAPSWRDGLRWCALAAVPAALLIAVTAHISTDVAAVPLLWVVPLALYLLTFVIVFQRAPLLPHWLAVGVQPLFILALVVVVVFDLQPLKSIVGLFFPEAVLDPVKAIIAVIALHCAAFFVNALVCHGELARQRPAARHLTIFYLWIAAGGMIGGIAAGLIAPRVFNWVAEYPILIALAALCRPGLTLPAHRQGRYLMLGALAAIVLFMIAFDRFHPDFEETSFDWMVGAFLVAAVLFWRAPLPFAAAVAVALFIDHTYVDVAGTTSVRSFFGVHKIADSEDGQFRVLSHGTTLHGAERIRDANGSPVSGRPDILMYYYDGSAMAQVMDMVRGRNAAPLRYAVVGLGAGSLACRSRPADIVHYYEIDPAIIHIARDSGLFHFLSACRPDVPIMLGDARLTLADAPDGAYDIIYVDAFTSDAIPIHLITREAMAIYLRKLSPHGIVVVHISNRFLELASVVAGIAAANGAVTRLHDGSDFVEKASEYLFVGTVAAVARDNADFGALARSDYWALQTPDLSQWVWTDDYSNIVGAVIRQIRPAAKEGEP
ncbi:MAG TPA: fused MFS/spermidine synthase [Xanthobacteraceae bacterium]